MPAATVTTTCPSQSGAATADGAAGGHQSAEMSSTAVVDRPLVSVTLTTTVAAPPSGSEVASKVWERADAGSDAASTAAPPTMSATSCDAAGSGPPTVHCAVTGRWWTGLAGAVMDTVG